MNRFLLSTLLLMYASVTWGKKLPGSAPGNPPALLRYAEASPYFIENKGQVTDQNNNPRTDIQFKVAAAPGLNIFIGNGAIHYQFSKATTGATFPSASGRKNSMRSNAANAVTEMELYRMDVTITGADKNAQVITEEKLDYYENNFTQDASANGTRACAYNKITYRNIRPHIDWVLYISNGKLKHEFVVNEGGSATDIQLTYGGATGLQLNADGTLRASSPLGTIREQAPVAYQADGTPVSCKFVLNGDALTFAVGEHSGTLVIDPTLTWATYYGGYAPQVQGGVATDKSGNVYISASTVNTTGIATIGAYHATIGGTSDAYLAKFSSSGSRLWATYFGGSVADDGFAVSTDDSGNVFIAGETSSTSGIATAGAYQPALSGVTDAFLARFDSTGSIRWATYYGGPGVDMAEGVVTDGTGNVYITGSTGSVTGIATTGAYQTAFGGGSAQPTDAFLAKFNGAGIIQWATYLGGNGDDAAAAIAADGKGHIYIAGATASPAGIATPGAFMSTFTGANAGFLSKFSEAGAIIWSTYFNGSIDAPASGVATDTSGNVYMVGTTSCTSGIATPGAHQVALHGAVDGYLAKFSGAGALDWATYYGGRNNDEAWAVATNISGNVFITGPAGSPDNIATPGAYDTVLAGIDDAYLAIFTGAGVLQWATYYGGNNTDIGNGLAMDQSGNIYLSGITSSTNGIATAGAYQDTLDGGFVDAFLAKFSICSALPGVGMIAGRSVVCKDSSITLTDTAGGGIWTASNASATVSGGLVRGVSAGADTIYYTVSNDCGQAVAKQIVTVLTTNCDTAAGVNTFAAGSEQINIYPNPATNELTIASPYHITSVTITNPIGQVFYNTLTNADKVQLNVADLPAGIYLLRINGTEVKKVMKR